MACKKELEKIVKTVFAALLALLPAFRGFSDVERILEAHLQTSYDNFVSEEFVLAETWTEEDLVEVAAYAILRTTRSEFQQLLLATNNHHCMLYITFLLCPNNRKYVRSIVHHKNWRKVLIIIKDQYVMVKEFIKQHLQVKLSQEEAMFYVKCFSSVGETVLAKIICKIWRLKLIESDWFDGNQTDDSDIYIPRGNPASLQYRISTLVTSPRSVDPRLLARLGFFYNVYKNAQCIACGSIVTEQKLEKFGIAAVWHTEDCEFLRPLNGNVLSYGLVNSLFSNHFVLQSQDTHPVVSPRPTVKKKNIHKRPCNPPGQRSVYIPPGDSAKESYRLSTFDRFPVECPASPRLFASAGFYYTGYKDRVKCFCCGICIESWTQDDDVTSSRWHYEDCQMMLHEDCGNIPLSSTSVNFSPLRQTTRPIQPSQPLATSDRRVQLARNPLVEHQQLIRSLKLKRERDRLIANGGDTYNIPLSAGERPLMPRGVVFQEPPDPNDTEQSDFFDIFPCLRPIILHMRDAVNKSHDRWPTAEVGAPPRVVNGNDVPHMPSAGERPAAPKDVVTQKPPNPSDIEQRDLFNNFPCLFPASPHMRSEVNRFQTFGDRWKAGQVRAPPRQIAKAGFFFLGDRDRVKCWYCNGGLQNWDPDDEPWTEHAKWFPTCEFLLQQKGPDFVYRIVGLFPNLPRPRLRGAFDVPPMGGRPGTSSPPPPIIDPRRKVIPTFPCELPKSPDMRDEVNRFRTFDKQWPAAQVRAPSRLIARAGFYFLGDQDRVKCWYCGVELQNWAPNDEPWTEHAKRFPTCEFVLQRKGPRFVQLVAGFSVFHRGCDLPTFVGSSSPPPAINYPKVELRPMEERVDDAMHSGIVTCARQMGFSDRQIRNVITRRLQSGGQLYTDLRDLIEDAIALSDSESTDDVNSTALREVNLLTHPSRAIDVMDSASEISDRQSGTSMEERIRELRNERKCKICLENLADVVFIPCGHICACMTCVKNLKNCPICQKKFENVIRL